MAKLRDLDPDMYWRIQWSICLEEEYSRIFKTGDGE